MLLGFLRLGILAFEVGERHIQRFVTEADSDGVDRDAGLVERFCVGLAEPMKLCVLNASFLCDRLQLAQEVIARFALTVRKH